MSRDQGEKLLFENPVDLYCKERQDDVRRVISGKFIFSGNGLLENVELYIF